jgi:hypothetical protein
VRIPDNVKLQYLRDAMRAANPANETPGPDPTPKEGFDVMDPTMDAIHLALNQPSVAFEKEPRRLLLASLRRAAGLAIRRRRARIPRSHTEPARLGALAALCFSAGAAASAMTAAFGRACRFVRCESTGTAQSTSDGHRDDPATWRGSLDGSLGT